MRIIEIAALDNGAHRNQTGTFSAVPDGWAEIPDGMETPNFPFGEVTVDDTQTPPIVTKWTAGTIPEPELEPDPQPTTEERVAALEAENKLLKEQVSAQADQAEFYEDCIAEMATVVYA